MITYVCMFTNFQFEGMKGKPTAIQRCYWHDQKKNQPENGFENYIHAREYMNEWLGDYGPYPLNFEQWKEASFDFSGGQSIVFDYTGFGDCCFILPRIA